VREEKQSVFKIKLVSLLIYLASYIISRSVFVETHNFKAVLKLRRQKKNFIYASWHSRFFYLLFSRRNEGIAAMASKSEDGEFASRVLHSYGFRTVRGSSSSGGEFAAFGMIKLLKRGFETAITVDGPKGPEKVLKPGIVSLAKITGVPLVPIASAFRDFFTTRSWDNFIVPFPFTRGVVAYGDPIYIPQDADENEYTKIVTEKINETAEKADRLAGL